MDEIYLEMAQRLTEAEIEQGIARVRQGHGESPEYNDQGERICIDCGIVIPAKRIEIVPNVVRCVDCQFDYEVEEKRYGK
jgi:DnaK suppressor protein